MALYIKLEGVLNLVLQNQFSSLANGGAKFHIQAFSQLCEILEVQVVEPNITFIGLFRFS